MKKLFTLFIIGIVSITTFCSCGDEAFDTDSVNKQTILIFMPWTGGENAARNSGLTSYLRANIDSIDAAIVRNKGLNNSRVLLFFGNSATEANLYDLVYNGSNRSVDHVVLNTYSDKSYTTPDGFASILNEVQSRATALNYALIIGAHGCGWTFKDSWVSYPTRTITSGNVMRKNTAMSQPFSFGDDPNHPLTRFFGSVSSTGNMMDVTDLAESIKKSGIKMQYILFDACYMGNVETAYELKDVTNYMIASSSEILAKGVPYYSLWNYLNTSTPGYSSIVSGFCNFYNKTNSPYANLAAIDCRQMDKLAAVMKDINAQYKLSDEIDLDSIQPLDGFDLAGRNRNIFYDLETYVDSMYPSSSLKSQFTTQLKATVKAAQSTENVISTLTGNTRYIKVKHYSGLSISDPSSHSVAINGKEKTGWWKATHIK